MTKNRNRWRLGILLCALLVLPSFGRSAEYADTSDFVPARKRERHQIKWNVLLVGMKNLQLSYEYGFHPKHTLGTSINYLLPRTLPKRVLNYESVTLRNGRFYGYGVNLQYKYYPYGGKVRPYNGIYFGAQFRYQRLRYNVDVEVENTTLNTDFRLQNILNSYGAGIEVGYQVHFSSHWLLDISFFGPRYAYNVYKARGGVAISGDVYDELAHLVRDYVGFNALGLLQGSGGTLVKQSFAFYGLRYGVSLGYAF